jgi:diaminohydroxyphosphoribosylaminopyrimidine deaminase/5-amino-6-(5-phosphoribosylamino)uracil reductase
MANLSVAEFEYSHMARALELAARGEGLVEPNPMVGCVVVRDGTIVGEGWHEQFGGPHAEIHALKQAGAKAKEATLYVTLEPCCHQGKTPPCTEAIIRAGIGRVVIAAGDPFPQVAGGGIAALEAADIPCSVGLVEAEARQLLSPYLKLTTTGRPWTIAKWAMTRDGMLAAPDEVGRWISSEASREVVHRLRGRVDAIVVGSGTVQVDDPLLTARPVDSKDRKRMPVRVVIDSAATLPLSSKLVQSANESPVLVAVGSDAPSEACRSLAEAGVEIFSCNGSTHADRLQSLLDELGRRQMTNVLVEGGSRLLKILFELQAIDEVHVFIATKIVGGTVPAPFAGMGTQELIEAIPLCDATIDRCDGDNYLHGRVG